MRIEQVAEVAGVTGGCMPGAGATPSCRIAASPTARSSLPPPAFQVSRTYLSRIPDSSALDTKWISSASVADP
jgi:hypothetical protein